jgi:hypothetical protein
MWDIDDFLGSILWIVAIGFIVISYFFDYEERFYMCKGDQEITSIENIITNKPIPNTMFRTEMGGFSWSLINVIKKDIWPVTNLFSTDLLLFENVKTYNWNDKSSENAEYVSPIQIKKESKWRLYESFQKETSGNSNFKFNLVTGSLEVVSNYGDVDYSTFSSADNPVKQVKWHYKCEKLEP